jgi:transcriptional regulator with XRE-family HTH domain
MTQADLERATGAASGTVSRWVRGTFAPTDPETVINVAHAVRARDAIAALDAAGLSRVADLIRQVRTEQGADPMLVRIRTDRILNQGQKEDLENAYLRTQAETLHYFELRLADAQARANRQRPAPASASGRAVTGRSETRWARLLRTAMAAARQGPAELAARSGGALSEGTIAGWLAGADGPTAVETILVARLLGQNEPESLRAAGYPKDAAVADAALQALEGPPSGRGERAS